MLPAAAALLVLAQPIIDVLFRRGAFGPAEVRQTAAALSAFALGLPALMLVKSLAPGFFAREDTKTPVKIAVLIAVLNVGLAAMLMAPLRHVGIALAASVANWVNALLLAAILRRRGFLRIDARFDGGRRVRCWRRLGWRSCCSRRPRCSIPGSWARWPSEQAP